MRGKYQTHLVNELATMYVLVNKDLCPKLWLTTFHKVTGLLFEHGVIIGDCNEFIVAEALGISNVRQVRVTFLAELPND
jgi:hypothetical protein